MGPGMRTVSALICFWTALTAVRCELKLTVLHTNDMHSRFEDYDAAAYNCQKGCFGGFARLKTAVDRARQDARAKGREVLFLNAGDTFAGSIFFIRFGSTVVVPMLQTLGLDIMSLGNHEFDGHTKMLGEFLEKINIPVVCANIDNVENEPKFKNHNIKNFTPSKVLEIGPKKVKVAVVGYLTYIGTENLGELKLYPEVEPIKSEVERLKKQGIRIFIALGHSGFDVDQEIARLVPDVDLVVGGHTDTFLYTGKDLPSTERPEGAYPTIVTQERTNRKVLVVQAYGYTKYLGNLEITFDDNGEIIHDLTAGNPILVDDKYKRDPAVTAVLKPFWDILTEEKVTRVIGRTGVFLDGGHNCHIRECNMGNLITDSYVYVNAMNYDGPGWTDAPVAVYNAGGIRLGIDTEKYGSRDLTFLQLSSSLIYTNPLYKVTMTGAELKQMLEHSVHQMVENIPHQKTFLQISGMFVRYDISKPPYQRVVQVRVRCAVCSIPKYERLKDNNKYGVITTKYVANGHDGFDILKTITTKEIVPHLKSERHAVETYLSHIATVYPGVEGRIRFVKNQSKIGGKPGVGRRNDDSSRLTELLTDAVKTQVLDRLPIAKLVKEMPLAEILKKGFRPQKRPRTAAMDAKGSPNNHWVTEDC